MSNNEELIKLNEQKIARLLAKNIRLKAGIVRKGGSGGKRKNEQNLANFDENEGKNDQNLKKEESWLDEFL